MRMSDWMSDVCSSDLAAKALHRFHQNPAVPAPVEDVDVASGGQPGPEPPEIVAVLFLGWRRAGRPDLEIARVHLGGGAADDSALARRVPALQHHDRPPERTSTPQNSSH